MRVGRKVVEPPWRDGMSLRLSGISAHLRVRAGFIQK
jgi:hypothetical protein